jgi:Rab-GTPase-TBC domain
VTNAINTLKDKESRGLNYQVLSQKDKITVDEYLQIEKDVLRTFFPPYHEAKQLEQEVDLNPDLEAREKDARLAEASRLRLVNEEMRERCQRILIAYSAADKQVGYVQGFNSIVAALLYINFQSEKEWRETQPVPPNEVEFRPTFSEEEVFFIFYEFMHHLGWRKTFINGMEDIQRICEEFALELKNSDPKMYKKFFQNEVIQRANRSGTTIGLLCIVLSDDLHAHNPSAVLRQDTGLVLADRRTSYPLCAQGSALVAANKDNEFAERGGDNDLPQERPDEGHLQHG